MLEATATATTAVIVIVAAAANEDDDKQYNPGATAVTKEIVSAHYLNAKEWSLVLETEFYLKIVHKTNGAVKTMLSLSSLLRHTYHLIYA